MLQYHISDKLEVTVKISNNPYDIPPEKLFTMAARKNKKEAFCLSVTYWVSIYR